ncbi:PAAR domain-containing protein [Huaxiibacter chinensis]
MATGYFLVRGNKTTCGGSIISGCQYHSIHGIPTARVGDTYICGVDKKPYTILGGIPDYFIHGVQAAGTLHSKGSCACKCEFIPSYMDVSYGYESEKATAVKARSQTQKTIAEASQPPTRVTPDPIPPLTQKKEEPREPVDAGYCIVPWNGSPSAYEPYLFNGASSDVIELYKSLNPEQIFKAGSILLVVDPLKQDQTQIKHIQQAKERINVALEPLTEEEASFLYKNKHVIDLFSSVGSEYGGLVTEAANQYFTEIERTLIQIQNTYQNQLITHGTLIGEQFYIERAALFKKLDGIFAKIFRKPMGLADYADIKKALRLSSHSIMHRWNETGVADIEGYATYIERSAKIVKIMKGLGYAGIGLSGLNGANTIYDACTMGAECEKTAFIEVGKFSLSTAITVGAGDLIVAGSGAACVVALGALSAPVGGAGALACTIIVSGGAVYAAGKSIEAFGGFLGEKIYNVFYK